MILELFDLVCAIISPYLPLRYFTLKCLVREVNSFSLQEVVQECQDMNWGTFKTLLTDALVDHMHPIQVLPLYIELYSFLP